MKLKYVNSKSDYIEQSKNIQITNEIPILSYQNTYDEKSLYEISQFYKIKNNKFKKRKIILLNEELLFLKHIFRELVEDCEFDFLDVNEFNSDIKFYTVVGLYQDFQHKRLEYIVSLEEKGIIKVEYLIGRDIQSLTFLIAKQFLYTDIKEKLIISAHHMTKDENDTVNKLRNEHTQVFSLRDLKKSENIDYLRNHFFKTIVILSHGKDDHTDLYDYTLCGKCDKQNVTNEHSPLCGKTGKCFKNNNKLVYARNLKAENILIASCHTGPFSDEANYSEDYNLAMAAVDSYANNVIYASSVTRFGIRELKLLSGKKFIKNKINDSLKDVQPIPVFNMIGLEKNEPLLQINEEQIQGTSKYSEWKSIHEQLTILLNSIVLYGNNELENELHSLLKECLLLSSKYKRTLSNSEKRLIEFKEKLFEFEQHFAAKAEEDFFFLGNMSSLFLEHMDACQKHSIDICECKNKMYTYRLKHPLFNYEKINESFCYRCGDKGFQIGESIRFRTNMVHISDNKIESKVSLSFINEGKVICGIIFPNYLKNNIIAISNRKTYEIGDERNKEIIFQVKLSNSAPKQMHYFGVYVIQNLSICFRRITFEL